MPPVAELEATLVVAAVAFVVAAVAFVAAAVVPTLVVVAAWLATLLVTVPVEFDAPPTPELWLVGTVLSPPVALVLMLAESSESSLSMPSPAVAQATTISEIAASHAKPRRRVIARKTR